MTGLRDKPVLRHFVGQCVLAYYCSNFFITELQILALRVLVCIVLKSYSFEVSSRHFFEKNDELFFLLDN